MFQAMGGEKSTQGFTDDFNYVVGLLWDDLLQE